MKKIFIEAHKMTREIANKYQVDYQAQFGLCISYLLEKEEEKKMLKGTEKQIKWAEDIKEKMGKNFSYYMNTGIVEYYNTLGFGRPLVETNEKEVKETFEKLIEKQDSAKWFIDNRNEDVVELVKREIEESYIVENIDLDIFKDATDTNELNKLAYRHARTLIEEDKNKFMKIYSDRAVKDIILELIK